MQARVVLACRDRMKGGEAVRRIQKEVSGGRVECVGLDLADFGAIREFAGVLAGRGEAIDMLVNNAGVMAVPRRRLTKDGFELQFGTNHLGHFALTGLLLPWLLRSRSARVVTVSSIAHKGAKMEWDNLNGECRYKDLWAYKLSKLANLLFANELQRRAAEAGVNLVSVAAHPGVATTNLFSAGSRLDRQPLFSWLTEKFVPLLGQSAARRALPILYAAVGCDVSGGDYYGPSGGLEYKGYPVLVKATAEAGDREVAGRLWSVSEELTHVTYGALAQRVVPAAAAFADA